MEKTARLFYVAMIAIRHQKQVYSIPTRVIWVNDKCPSGKRGIYQVKKNKGVCYEGLTFSCQEMYVLNTGKIYNSAYTHELAHCYHQKVYGDMDPGHTDLEWWKTVKLVDSELERAGI